jgi:ElaB/YqjD/DUF883 family membrane-anchored ribosome-binding protein
MSSTQKPGDEHRSLPDDIALAAGLPRGGQGEGPLHSAPTPGTYTASTHTGGTQTHSIQNEGSKASSVADDLKSRAADAQSKAGDLKDRAADAAQDARERVTDTVQDLRARASSAVDDARGWVEDTHRSGRRQIGDLGERGSARLQGLRYARDFTDRGREFVASALDPENLNAVVQRASGTEEPGPAPRAGGTAPQQR